MGELTTIMNMEMPQILMIKLKKNCELLFFSSILDKMITIICMLFRFFLPHFPLARTYPKFHLDWVSLYLISISGKLPSSVTTNWDLVSESPPHKFSQKGRFVAPTKTETKCRTDICPRSSCLIWYQTKSECLEKPSILFFWRGGALFSLLLCKLTYDLWSGLISCTLIISVWDTFALTEAHTFFFGYWAR